MNKTLRHVDDLRHVRAELLFADPAGEAPTVVIPRNDESTVRRGGLDYREVLIASGRDIAATFSIDREGFAFVTGKSAVRNFEDDGEIEQVYYPEIKKIVADATGASEVEIFDHTLRVTDPETTYRRPASHAHNDYTDTSGPKRLRDMIGDERADEWLKDRLVQVNVWRPIVEPVLRMPLALLDASSTEPSDLIETTITNERQNGRVGRIYSVAHRDGQRWFYFPEMTMDQAILIKGYDSLTDGRARFTPHSAFEHPATPADAPARRSIEVRTFARIPA
ncbi:MAG: CmcJ/NvfI family oxidoreductase [Rhodospirillales bacterium]